MRAQDHNAKSRAARSRMEISQWNNN